MNDLRSSKQDERMEEMLEMLERRYMSESEGM